MNTITIDDKQLAVNAMIHNMKEIDPDGSHAGLISPIEALSYVRAHHVDVAFLDIEMPDMNGLEMAEALKKIQPDINIVFVTGHAAGSRPCPSAAAAGNRRTGNSRICPEPSVRFPRLLHPEPLCNPARPAADAIPPP